MTEQQVFPTEHFVCQCHSPEHTLRFDLDLDPDDPHLYTSVYLNHWRPWYKRTWIAIKYIFGYTCKYGHFDCFEMKQEDAGRLRDLIDRLATFQKNNS